MKYRIDFRSWALNASSTTPPDVTGVLRVKVKGKTDTNQRRGRAFNLAERYVRETERAGRGAPSNIAMDVQVAQ